MLVVGICRATHVAVYVVLSLCSAVLSRNETHVDVYDIVVIGGGPAGVTAALRARELGASVALVERNALGGTCTNDGCAPTRVLAKAARLVRDAEQFADYGLRGDRPIVDFPAMTVRLNEVVKQLHEKKNIADKLRDSGVALIENAGAAVFTDPQHIQLGDGTQVEGKQFIICAGGRARHLDFPGSEFAKTHHDVWSMTTLPRSVAIIGASATGCQLASIFSAFGSQVTLLELAPRVIPGEDETTSRAVAAAFERRGIEVITGMGGVSRIEQHGNSYTLVYKQHESEAELVVDVVLVAVGWPGNADQLGLEAAGVKSERSYITVDDSLRTSQPHIFAAGDITGRMMLVQGATDEALIAAQNAALGRHRIHEHRVVPHGGFTDPEYGSVGLTEAKAREQHEIVVATVPYADLDRAVIDGRTEGFCKLIVSRETHQILGAHVVGEQAVEIVHIVAAIMQTHSTIVRLAELEIAYPTFAAVVGLAARQILREIGAIPASSSWGTFTASSVAEWERS